MTNHILYSYRRCPYAVRARMVLRMAQIQCDVHEIDFKNKPQAMLDISPKGTVPVLHLFDGTVIDESLDIINWVLHPNDPLLLRHDGANDLISENDGVFKAALDRYKYPNRFPEEDCSTARDNAQAFLKKLDGLLQDNKNLLGDNITLADIAIFPFIRQCANVDRAWFDALPYANLQAWLADHLNSDLFTAVIKKQNDNPYQLI